MRKLARHLILYSNILFAILLLLSYLSPYINPGRFLFPAFLGLAYPYLLIVNCIYFIYWLVRFRKELLISLIIISIGWGHVMNLFPINVLRNNNGTISENDPSLRIMSYNVRTFNKYSWNKNGNSRDGIFEVISDNDPDILCLQEFYTINKTGQREGDIRQKLKSYPWNSIYYSIHSSKETGFGIATYSKYPIIKTSRIPFDNTMNQAVYSDILVENDTFRVFNIHLQSIRFGEKNYSFLDTISFKYGNKQIAEVKDIGNRLRNAFVLRAEQSKIIHNYILDSPYRVIVSGDFNDTPLSYAYNRIHSGLTDAFRHSGSGLGNTYAGDFPSYRIDFIMHSKEMESEKFNRIKSRYSDHFPIVAVLRYKKTEATE